MTLAPAPMAGECASCGKRVRLVGWSGERPIYGHLTNPTYMHHAVRLARPGSDARPGAVQGRIEESDTRREDCIASADSSPRTTAKGKRASSNGLTRTAKPSGISAT